jgi:GNAT superfamily N-acetyltransferase
MIKVRPARWPEDIVLLSGLDTEFETGRSYRLVRDKFSFHLEEEAIKTPLKKKYDLNPAKPGERALWHLALIAEEDDQLAGFAAAEHEHWNNRMNIRHIYVAPAFRRRGVGTRLLQSIEDSARTAGARSLWLETQNTNYPAIQFYLWSGFWFCGFDAGLYDPETVLADEIALFFERPVNDSP